MSINPMFNQKALKKEKQLNVRNSDNPVIKKARSDKKTDIKIPLTVEQRKQIRGYAKVQNMNITNFCSYTVKKGLIRNIPFPEVEAKYPSSSKLTVHVKLEDKYLTSLDDWCIRWDCSRRVAAYRILTGLIKIEGKWLNERKF